MTAPATMLTRAEEQSLFSAWRSGDETARDRILIAYMPLVRRIANRFRFCSYDDLYQEGVLGLMKALDKFEPARGFRLGTYANYWVRATIGEYLIRTSRDVRPSMTTEGKRAFSRGELTHEVSLQAPARRGLPDTTALSNIIPDSAPGPDSLAEEAIDGRRRRAKIVAAINNLDPRSRHIILRRFLANETFDEIAAPLGVTRERVRQIQNAALAKMREGIEA